VHEVDSSKFNSQRRRSERVSQPLPLIVRGIDLLGQPFEERTSALAYNFHGCRYSSKHHLPPNAWVTLEIEHDGQVENVRARVAWTQRPRSIRDFFQVGVELEVPANIWGLPFPPEDWRWQHSFASGDYSQAAGDPSETGGGFSFASNSEGIVSDTPFDSPLHTVFASASGEQSGFASNEPQRDEQQLDDQQVLLRNLNEELRRQAREAVEAAAARVTDDLRASIEEVHQQRLATSEEFFQTWKQEFSRVSRPENEPALSSGELTPSQTDFLNDLKLKFEERFSEARNLLEQLDQKAQTIRSEAEAISQETPKAEQSAAAAGEPSGPTARWNELLDREMKLAQSQWNELLQSSLDGGIHRLASQLSEHSRESLRTAEQRLAERFEELRQPLAETAAEARQVLNSLRSELEEEMSRARGSLVDIEHVAGRIKDYSTQLEASSHDTLNELHRRLENILESQTDQLNRHAEQLLSGITERLNPTIEALGRQLVERTIFEVEQKLAPRLDRVPELIRELSAREVQADESLRLHRERLRQSTENNQRDVAAQMESALANLRRDFEQAGSDALSNWNEQLRESATRASQVASDAIGQSSEWFQEEARAHLQVSVEQSMATAGTNLDDLAAQAAAKHAKELDRQSSLKLAEAQTAIDNAASEAASRGRSQLEEAAQAAAASFGQVLRNISDGEVQQFSAAVGNVAQERSRDFDAYAQQALGNFSVSADAGLEALRTRMASEVETSVSHGRETLSGELSSVLDRFSAEGDTRKREWGESLDRLSQEATTKHEERLQTACDAWIVSSVRRLNEHGQSTIESLMRVTDQALRESCSKVFESLAQMMRERNAASAAAGAYAPAPSHESPENSSASAAGGGYAPIPTHETPGNSAAL
jgi:archaellum component FlaC